MNTREHRERHDEVPLEEVRREAHRLWQLEGCPEGRELDHWLAAKEIVRRRRHPPPAAPDDPREPVVQPTEKLVTPN